MAMKSTFYTRSSTRMAAPYLCLLIEVNAQDFGVQNRREVCPFADR
jgi:hypothetical protein